MRVVALSFQSTLIAENGGGTGLRSDTTNLVGGHLLHVRPAVWRRVLVPADLTLNDLHSVLQHAMGWEHVHLYRFEMFSEIDPTAPLKNFLRAERDWVTYVYDFGDEWEHEVRVEKVRSGQLTVTQLPWVLAGARACPPEEGGF